MMISNPRLTALRLALAALTVAVIQPMANAQTPKAPMSASSAMSSEGMNMKDMMKDMGGKMSSMSMSGDQDVDFAMMMRMHHQGAIDMAQAELASGKDPQMKKMAKAIIAAQKKEIAQFDAFLHKRGSMSGK